MDLEFRSTLGKSDQFDLGPFSALAALNVDATHGVEVDESLDLSVWLIWPIFMVLGGGKALSSFPYPECLYIIEHALLCHLII